MIYGKMNGVIKLYLAVKIVRRAGVAILFKSNFDFVLNKDYADPGGRFIILDIKTTDLCFTLVNLYAPNKDDPLFFQNVKNRTLEFDCDNIILGWTRKVAFSAPRKRKSSPK